MTCLSHQKYQISFHNTIRFLTEKLTQIIIVKMVKTKKTKTKSKKPKGKKQTISEKLAEEFGTLNE